MREITTNVGVHNGCDPNLLNQLDNLLRTTHPYVKLYKNLGQKVGEERRTHGNDRIPEIGLYFETIPGTNRNIYAAPTTSEEIGAVFTSIDGNLPPPNSCVRVFYSEKGAGYSDIPKLSPIVDRLCYPLLFPNGELGWTINLSKSGDRTSKRKRISKRDFDRYRLMTRKDQLNPILFCGKLSQQYIVDKYDELEGDRLNYWRIHQKDARADTYVGHLDYLARKNATVSVENGRIGRAIILPSSFYEGPRCRVNVGNGNQ